MEFCIQLEFAFSHDGMTGPTLALLKYMKHVLIDIGKQAVHDPETQYY